MKMAKRIVALILVLLMTLPILIACRNDNEVDSDNTTVDTTAGEDRIDNLPDDLNFGGVDVTIFYRQVQDQSFNNYSMELEGDFAQNGLTKAVYERNFVVEQRLGINLVFEPASGNPNQSTYKSDVEKMVLAEDSSVGIDIIYHFGGDAANQANMGYFRQIPDLPYVEINQPYWYTTQMKGISFNENENYLLIGELLTSNIANMTSIFFNKEMFNNLYARENKDYNALYDMIEAGNWTYEEYYKIVSEAYQDDGNGFKNIGDKFGAHYESSSGRTGSYYPYTSGIKFCARDSSGFIKLNFNQDKTISLVEDMYSFVNENKGTIDMTVDEARDEFLSGNMLFYTYFLSHGAIVQAEAGFEYGVVPFPKYDENCEYTSIVLTGAGVYVIPRFVPNDRLEVIGATLEAMCSESSKHMTTEYYERIVKIRQAGGERDATMIDTIKNSLNTDFTFWCGASIGRPGNLFKTLVIDQNSKNFVSYWQTFGPAYDKYLEGAIETYKKARY